VLDWLLKRALRIREYSPYVFKKRSVGNEINFLEDETYILLILLLL
jgi:hypothetical protein